MKVPQQSGLKVESVTFINYNDGEKSSAIQLADVDGTCGTHGKPVNSPDSRKSPNCGIFTSSFKDTKFESVSRRIYFRYVSFNAL